MKKFNIDRNWELLGVADYEISMYNDGIYIPSVVNYTMIDMDRIRNFEWNEERVCYYAYSDFDIEPDDFAIVCLCHKEGEQPELLENGPVEAFLVFEDEDKNRFVRVQFNKSSKELEIVD